MKTSPLSRQLPLASATILIGALALAGCRSHADHPDEKSSVTTSLDNNNLSAISVSQDRDKGVITLSGNVTSNDLKAQAENLARQAAPDYTIADEIGVRPPENDNAGAVASNLDTAIEHNYKAAIKQNANLDDQSIDFSAKNGTLVLKGSVKTLAQKHEAERLAKKVPNVQQVVNEIKIDPGKHSSSAS